VETCADDIAEQLAKTEAAYLTVRLMQTFNSIECRDGTVWKEQLSLTCCSDAGTLVGLTPAAC
jgi:hypothetical protein